MQVPDAPGEFRHSVDIQTRFNDADIFGHINNSSYLQYLDLGKVRYFEAVTGLPMTVDGPAVVIVNINCSFYSPAYIYEPLTVLTRCVKISHRSFTLCQRVVNRSNGDVKCEAYVVMAGFVPSAARGCELLPSWVKGLREFEHGEI